MSKNIIDTSKKLTDSSAFKRLLKISKQESNKVLKNIADSSEWNNFDGGETPVLNSVSNELGEKQLEKLVLLIGISAEQAESTSKILESSERQSENANKQFKATKRLTYFIIIISLISIIPTLKELISPNQNMILFEHILKLEEEKSQNTELISVLSNNLLDLENQVQTLEKQKSELSKKKID